MCKQSKWFCNCHAWIPKPEWWDSSVGMGYSLAPEHKQSGIPLSLCLVNILFGSTKHKGSFRVHMTVQEVIWDHNSTWWLALSRCCTPREIGMQVSEFAKDTRHVQGIIVQLLLKLSHCTHLIVHFYRYSSNRQELNCCSNCHAPQMCTLQDKTFALLYPSHEVLSPSLEKYSAWTLEQFLCAYNCICIDCMLSFFNCHMSNPNDLSMSVNPNPCQKPDWGLCAIHHIKAVQIYWQDMLWKCRWSLTIV